MIEDLFKLTLADGIPVDRDGKTIRYRVAHLRETGVAHERQALRMAERVVAVGGQPKLLVSEADFRYAMTMLHVAAFECDGMRIGAEVIDLDLFGKLSSHDMGLIEQRVFLISLASQVRYGLITQEQFDAIASGAQQGAPQAPQPGGQAASTGATAPAGQSGPEVLADYSGRPAPGAAAGTGG